MIDCSGLWHLSSIFYSLNGLAVYILLRRQSEETLFVNPNVDTSLKRGLFIVLLHNSLVSTSILAVITWGKAMAMILTHYPEVWRTANDFVNWLIWTWEFPVETEKCVLQQMIWSLACHMFWDLKKKRVFMHGILLFLGKKTENSNYGDNTSWKVAILWNTLHTIEDKTL